MKQKTIKIVLALTFLAAGFFGMMILNAGKVYAATCTLTTAWGDQSQNVISPPSSTTFPQTYSAMITFQNCVGYRPVVYLYGPGYGTTLGTSVNLGSSISQNPEIRWAYINLTQAGGYYFAGNASNSNVAFPNGDIYSSHSSTVNAAAAISNGKIYACKAGDGVYACSRTNSKDLHDVTSDTGGCQYDYTDPGNVALQVDPSWCGKTDAQIQQQTANPGATPAPAPAPAPANPAAASNPAVAAAAGQPDNSSSTLYNPIPGANNITELLVNIMKGFLAIIAVWAVAFIVIGGFRMVISSGNEEMVLAAKKTITWAVLGLLVAVLSFAIIAIVQNLVGVQVQVNTPGNSIPVTPGNSIPATPGN